MLTILLLSCRRLNYLERTLAAVRGHFDQVEPGIQPVWICFDNGSSEEDRRRLAVMGFDLLLLSRENLGIGPAMNRLVSAVRTPYFLNLQDDWLLENPGRVPFVRESVRILEADANFAQVKLDACHFLDFDDRQTYSGPYQAPGGEIPFFVQNPKMLWGGFTFPPAIARTATIHQVGPFREDQPFRRGWAESEFSGRFSAKHHVVKSPRMTLFKHIGEEHTPGGWGGKAQDVGAGLPRPYVAPPGGQAMPADGGGETPTLPDGRVPTYAILMVVYNALEMAKMATLRTLRHIEGQDARLVVVNNASDDGVQEWLQTLAQRGDIQLIHSRTNLGHGPALELARKTVRSPFLVTLDSDAFPLSDDWLPRLRERLSDRVKAAGILHHRNYIHPSCLMVERRTLDEFGVTFLNEKNQPSKFDVGERLSHEILRRGFEISGLKKTGGLRRGSRSEPVHLGSEYEGLVYHQWYTTRSYRAGGGPVDDVSPEDIEQSLREAFERYHAESRDVVVVMAVRAAAGQPERVRNARAALLSLNHQDLPRRRYRIVVVEQDIAPQLQGILGPLTDQYVFAYNPGAYNQGWGLNIGAALPGSRDSVLCLFCADILAPPDLLSRGLVAYRSGEKAFLPFTEVAYLGREATEHAIRDRTATPKSEFAAERYEGEVHAGSQGGCLWVDSALYRRIGGHDERFRGWGREDRSFCEQLGRVATVHRHPGRLLHLDHPRPIADPGQLAANAKLAEEIAAAPVPAPDRPFGDRRLYAAEAGGEREGAASGHLRTRMRCSLEDLRRLADELPASTDDRPDWLKALPSALDEGSLYYRFLFEFARRYGPRLVLDLGTSAGVSAAHLAAGNAGTTVVTVDVNPESRKIVEAQFSLPNLIAVTADTVGFGEAIKTTGAFPLYDAVFVDSEHSFHQGYREYQTFRPVLFQGGFFLFDDIHLPKAEGEMEALWRFVVDPKVELNRLHRSGFGAVQVDHARNLPPYGEVIIPAYQMLQDARMANVRG